MFEKKNELTYHFFFFLLVVSLVALGFEAYIAYPYVFSDEITFGKIVGISNFVCQFLYMIVAALSYKSMMGDKEEDNREGDKKFYLAFLLFSLVPCINVVTTILFVCCTAVELKA